VGIIKMMGFGRRVEGGVRTVNSTVTNRRISQISRSRIRRMRRIMMIMLMRTNWNVTACL
jgi:hypothetical protein